MAPPIYSSPVKASKPKFTQSDFKRNYKTINSASKNSTSFALKQVQ